MWNKKNPGMHVSLICCLKLALFSLLFFSCKPVAVLGQGGEPDAGKVAVIQKQVQTYKQNIEPCKDDEPCGYFSNRATINEHKGPWPAVGIYQVDRTFWYHRYFDEDLSEHAHRLDMVLVKTKRSARKEKETFFFDEQGGLIYYEFLMGDVEEPSQHIQFYFEVGKLLHFESKVVEEEEPYQRWKEEDSGNVLKVANWRMEDFKNDMRE